MAAADVIANIQVRGLPEYQRGMQQAGASAQQAAAGASQAGEQSGASAAGFAKAAAGAALMYKGYGALKDSVSTTVDLARSTAAFSRASGLSAKESGAWIAIAKQRGIETKQLQMGMATFGRQLGATGGSAKASAAALEKLGLNQQQLIAMPMEQRMSAVADAFSKLADGPEKAALAQKMFGRSGQALIPILNEGGAALKEQLKSASDLVPVNEQSQKSALALARAQREMGMATMGLKMAFGQMLIPILTNVAKVMTPVTKAVGDAVRAFPPLGTAVTVFAAALGAVKMTSWITGLQTSIIWAKLAAAAQWLFNASLFGCPIVWIIAGLAAVGAAFYLLYTKVGWFRNGVNAIWGALKAAFAWIKNNWKLVGPLLLAPLGPLGLLIYAFTAWRSQMIGILQSVWNFIKSVGEGIAGAFVSAFTWVKTAVADVVGFVVNNWRLIATGLLVVMGPIGWIGAAFLNFRGQIVGALSSAVGAIGNFIGAIWGAVGNVAGAIGGIVGTVASGIGSVVGRFASAVGQIGGAVRGWVSAVMGALGGLAGQMAGVAQSTVGALVSAFGAAFNKLWEIGKSIVDAIISGIKSGAGAILNAVKDIIPNIGEMIVDKAKSMAGSAASTLTFGALKQGGIIHAQGGMASLGGRTALVGERGPEIARFPSGSRITPLPPPQLLPSQVGAGGGNITVPVYLDRHQIATALASYSAERAAARG